MSERETKRQQFNEKKSSGRKLILPIVALLVIAIAVGSWFAFSPKSLAGHEAVQAAANGTIIFDASDYNDGKARFYRLASQSGPIDFFVVRSQDGVIRAAFDTCDVCYKERKGYRQEGADMVCNNCDQHFRTDLINVVKGGCNPAPLERQQQGEKIVIAVNDVHTGARYFN